MKQHLPQNVMKEDILEQLKFQDATPAMLNMLRCCEIHLEQVLARAADEIEKLRKENKELKKANRKGAKPKQ